MAVHYCSLCRRTSFTGRRHLYSTGHRRRLREALEKLQEEVGAGLGWVRDPPGPPPGALLTLLPSRSPEHRRETARFLRENRAEAALRERLVLSEEDRGRLAVVLTEALGAYEEQEEERIQQIAASIREAERRQRDTVRAALQVGAGPAASSSVTIPPRDSSHNTEQPGPSSVQTGPDLNWMESGQALTFIGHQETEGKGNVHTGAKPPWLTEEDEGDGSEKQIGPSYEEFLRQKDKQKLKKLPADRVGANFDHASQTGDSWLPSFGRVWNHGRRWQSR
ncbi:CCD84 protein, partial [Asarcornis scutulata]|nr:CCD84 protein [Asarcornis scutulata]